MSPHDLVWLALGAAVLVFRDCRRCRLGQPLAWALAVFFCSAPALLAYGWLRWRRFARGPAAPAWAALRRPG